MRKDEGGRRTEKRGMRKIMRTKEEAGTEEEELDKQGAKRYRGIVARANYLSVTMCVNTCIFIM